MSEPDQRPAAIPHRRPPPPLPVPSPSVRSTMSDMAGHLQSVIGAAERAAATIRHDAEQQAHQHLSNAQREADRRTAERVALISDLTDDLVRHAGTIRDHSEQMARALNEAIGAVTAKLEQSAPPTNYAAAPAWGGASTPDPASLPRQLPEVAPPAGHPVPESTPTPPDALLLATRLAVGGHDRSTIATALRDECGLTDPQPVLARVFGEN